MNILIVDDEQSMLSLYKRAFELEQFNVSTAENGAEALQLLNSGELPDLILLDIMMPRVNGLEFLDQLKSNTTFQHIPVVLLTNMGGKTNAELGMHKGAAKYLVKSELEPSEIVAEVRSILQSINQETE